MPSNPPPVTLPRKEWSTAATEEQQQIAATALLEIFRLNSDLPLEDFLTDTLNILIRHTGSQAAGFYRGLTGTCELICGVGGRSLGSIEKLGGTSEEAACYQQDYPAETWGSIEVPLDLATEAGPDCLRITGRSIREVDLGLIVQLVNGLETVLGFHLEQEHWQQEKSQQELLREAVERLKKLSLNDFRKSLSDELQLILGCEKVTLQPKDNSSGTQAISVMNLGHDLKQIQLQWSESLSAKLADAELMHETEFRLSNIYDRLWTQEAYQQQRSFHQRMASEFLDGIGESEAIRRINQQVKSLAAADLPAWISGEQGTGRTRIAQRINHQQTDIWKPALVIDHQNFATAMENQDWQLAAELFPCDSIILQEPESFEEAQLQRLWDGWQQRPSGGLRMLTTSKLSPEQIGELSPLHALFADHFALSRIAVPPLRERPEDIRPLLELYARRYLARDGKQPPQFSEAAMQLLLDYHWPGNIAELVNLIRRFSFLPPVETISAAMITTHLNLQAREEIGASSLGLTDATNQFQQEYIQHAISKADQNMTEAARLLGMPRTNLYRKMHQLEMLPEKNEPSAS